MSWRDISEDFCGFVFMDRSPSIGSSKLLSVWSASASSARELKEVVCLLKTVVLHCHIMLIIFSSSGRRAYADIPLTLHESEWWRNSNGWHPGYSVTVGKILGLPACDRKKSRLELPVKVKRCVLTGEKSWVEFFRMCSAPRTVEKVLPQHR